MVVKKFEARSMKEALEMVKAEMGPEAIIIAARDNSKRFGLVGEGSVEITAAIQPFNLQKKKLAEAKIPVAVREKIHRSSAKAHRELIEKSIARHIPPVAKTAPVAAAPQVSPAKAKPPVDRSLRYIDMSDEVEPAAAPNGVNEKMRLAAQKAWKTMHAEKSQEDEQRFKMIKGELDQLREVITNFREVPQTMVHGHPGSEYGINYECASIYEKLIGVGISTPLVVEILKPIQAAIPEDGRKHSGLIQGLVAKDLAGRIELAKENPGEKFEVFIGAGGHGKTTTLIKAAANLILNDTKKVAILTTDTQKFGASEQLKIYAQILNIPFMVISDVSQWEAIAEESKSFDKIFVDTPGVRFRMNDEMQKLTALTPPAYLQARTHLVISATSKDQDAIELGKRFATAGFDDVIFTALDESYQHGVLLNFQEALQKPFHSFGIGPRVPEDFELATRERVIDLLLGPATEFESSFNLNL